MSAVLDDDTALFWVPVDIPGVSLQDYPTIDGDRCATVALITVDYLKTRQQFGRPLADFQALQHRLADMLLRQELAASMAASA